MKILTICKSYHKMNTEKVANAMVQEMNAKLARVEDVWAEELEKYGLNIMIK